jgi:hypothetical protein
MADTQKDSVLRSVRIPADVNERLVEAAARDDRSVSYVIVKALERLLVPEGARRGKSDLQRQIDEEPDPRGVRTRPSPPPPPPAKRSPVERRTMEDANAEYTRMMAERQARMNRGS